MRWGFTLVELLVVIGILAILAALLFPAFARGRETSYKTTALSNLRQTTLASLLYAGDEDDALFPYYNGFDLSTRQYTGAGVYWPQVVAPYVAPLGPTHGAGGQALNFDLPRIFFDPALPLVPQRKGELGTIMSWGVSDAIVDWAGPQGYRPTRIPARLGELGDPAGTYLHVGTRDPFTNDPNRGIALALAPFSYLQGLSALHTTAGHYAGSSDFAHLPSTGQTLVSYADGHARSRKAAVVATDGSGWHRQDAGRWP